MNHTLLSLVATLGLCAALAAPAAAQDHSSHAGHGATPAAAGQDTVLTAGEITRVDTRGGKLTIRHEDIRNLDMPAMTMVFALKNPGAAADFKAGDKVLFHAEDDGGTLSITHINKAAHP
ncbi:copper-binding protein [Comamonas terrae]|uniref:Copper-binding protein n=1 Tax=Comamonas terrae TaxID=673548 RepID=A0ABW5US19_9BURK|nr:copper-binding protein [Comamonas terrae]